MKQQAKEHPCTQSKQEILEIIHQVSDLYASMAEKLQTIYPGCEVHLRVQGIETFQDHPDCLLEVIEHDGDRWIVGNYWSKCGMIETEKEIQGLFPKVQIIFKK